MILTTTEEVPNHKTKEILGIAQGSTIRSRHMGSDILAGFKHMVGGELKGYTKMIRESRDQAVERMTEHAKELGADAIVNVRFVTAEVMQGAAEVMAYGTAVKLVN
jgi:uncharacterized protein YbjQ (UPF0145 family)